MSEEKPYQVVFDPAAGLRTANNALPGERSFGSKRIQSTRLANWAVKGKPGGKKGGKKRGGSSSGTKKKAGRKRK